MPKQSGAQPVTGGEISPQLIETLRQQGQYAEQRHLQAVSERGQTQRAGMAQETAKMQVAGRERVAGIQAGTTKEIAAMQEGAEDERSAERIRMTEASLKMTGDLRRLDIESSERRDKWLYDMEQADHRRDLKEKARLEQEGWDRSMNDDLTSMAWQAVETATYADADRVRSQTAKGQAEAQKDRDQFDLDKTTNQGLVTTIETEIESFIQSSGWGEMGRENLPELGKIAKYGAKYRGIAQNAKIMDFFGIDWGKRGLITEAQEKEVQQRIEEEIRVDITKKVGEFTGNKWNIWANPELIQFNIEQGKLGYGDLYGGMTALRKFRIEIDTQVKDLRAAGAPDEIGAQRALYWGLSSMSVKIGKALSGIRRLETDETKKFPGAARMTRKARTLIENLPTEWLKEGIKDPEPPDYSGTLDYINELIESLGPQPEEFIGGEREKMRAQRMWEMKRKYSGELARLYRGRVERGK